MYSYNERMEVEKLLKQGINIKEISTNTGISISTLYKWKKEIELERHIQGLIKKGHIDDANNEINHLDSNYGREITALRLKSEIAKEEGDEEKEKDLLRERIEKNPEDIKAFWRLIKIIKSEGNGEEERILLEKQLKRNPNNVRIINRLIKLAQEQNDIERERSLQETKLKIDEKNVNTIGRLINLARLSNDVEREKELLQKLLEMNPRDPK